ncbi:hypothetical protein AB0F88_34690 [Streptosporangium sp. NPDC023963]|uniref:hypothetical protein n=1 Tax=Streptosporangium sp. NPDC023963 TaxID=3155608 RepID=UPI00342FE761
MFPSDPGRCEGEREGVSVPRGHARHRKDEEEDDADDVDDVDDVDDAVTRPMARRSWTYLDSRPFSMPPPPSPWRRPWARLSRDQLLRPALIAGFLAAAGVGVWSSGWSPWEGAPVAGPSPASPGERLLAGRDIVITPSRAPVVAETDAKAPAGKGKAPGGEKGPGAAGTGGGAGKKVPGRDPERVPRAEQALSGAGDIRDEWVERVERAQPVKKPVKRAGRHHEGSARAGTGQGGTGGTGAAAPEAGNRRADGGAGRGTASTGGDAGSAGTAGRPRSGKQGAGKQGSGAQGSGGREGRSQPRAGRTGAPATRSPSPSASRNSASRNRPPATGGAAGISAAYACRHLPSGDWRHAYCVRVWNDYKTRNGLR